MSSSSKTASQHTHLSFVSSASFSGAAPDWATSTQVDLYTELEQAWHSANALSIIQTIVSKYWRERKNTDSDHRK